MGLLVWIGLALAAFWAARCLQVGCTRMLPVAALLTGLLALWTPPGAALRAWLANSLVLGIRLLAWAAGPAHWAALSSVLVLGLLCALLLEPLPSAAETTASRAAQAAAEVGWWLASFVPAP